MATREPIDTRAEAEAEDLADEMKLYRAPRSFPRCPECGAWAKDHTGPMTDRCNARKAARLAAAEESHANPTAAGAAKAS